MLILTRKIGEALILGDDIVIKVLDINGSQVRIGVEAPKEISVYRSEIYQRIQLEKMASNKAKAVTKKNTAETFFSSPIVEDEAEQEKNKKARVYIKKKRSFVLPEMV